MADPKSLFTKVVLERLSSPEQLDVLMRVTSPIGWLCPDNRRLLPVHRSDLGAFLARFRPRRRWQGILIRGGFRLERGSRRFRTHHCAPVNVGDQVVPGQAVASIAQGGLSIHSKSRRRSSVRWSNRTKSKARRNAKTTNTRWKRSRKSANPAQGSIKDYQKPIGFPAGEGQESGVNFRRKVW